jgi:hypothetical protein
MAEVVNALAKEGVVINLVVTNEHTPDGWLDEYVAAENLDEHFVVDETNYAAIGWVKKGSEYVIPEQIESSKATITGDGKDTATVTYTDNRPSPPDQVTANVNGQDVSVSLTNGVGSLDVTSVNPGDTVVVTFPGVSTAIVVQ